MIERCVRTMSDGVLDPDVFRELQLPVKHNDPKKPSLGIGFTSARNIAAAAFLASTSTSNKLYSAILPVAIKALTTCGDAAEAYTNWSHFCLPSRIMPFSVFFSKDTPTRKKLTDAIHEKVQGGIPPGDSRKQKTGVLRFYGSPRCQGIGVLCPMLRTANKH